MLILFDGDYYLDELAGSQNLIFQPSACQFVVI